MGGHLSWFETGGGRWFAKPVSISSECRAHSITDKGQAVGFLRRMALEIDLSAPIKPETFHDRTTSKTGEVQPDFNPMRRKLQMHIVP